MAVVWSLMALLAAPQDDLRKEVEQLKEKVKALEAEKAAPAPAPEKDLMSVDDTTILDVLMRETKLGGFVDVGYIFNANRPKDQDGNKATNGVHIFTNDPNSFYAHNAQLELRRDPTKEVIVGYDVRLMVGSDAQGVDPDGTNDNFGLQQANIQILMPVGDGILWKLGRFATLAGAEVIEGKDNFNYTRSLPFNWAIPFTHTGIRGTYTTMEGKLGLTLGVNNGWDNQVDNNFGKTLEAQVMVAPIPQVTGYLNFYFGDEQVDATGAPNVADEDEKRTLIDIVVTIQNIEQVKGLTLQLNFDIGSQDESSALATASAGDDAEWTAFSIAGRYQVNEVWAGAIRYSMIDDKEGFRLGATDALGNTIEAKFDEITFTLEARPVKDLIVRAEVRIDGSDEDVFLDGKDADDSQVLFGLQAILLFN